MNLEGLNPRQRANVAGLRIKKDAIQRRYGNAVQILTTEEEAAFQPGWMALPLKELNTNKQVTLRMDRNVIDSTKAQKISSISRDAIPDTAGVVDVVKALEQAAGVQSTATNPRTEASTRVSKASKADCSAALSDAEFIANLLGK